MTLHQTIIGCDVCKSRLDIFNTADQTACSVANSKPAIAAWLEDVKHSRPLVVFEATGGCDRELMHMLQTAGVAYSRVNPARVRDFARASGVLAKTDAIDARVLADMGHRMQLQPDAMSCPYRAEIAELSSRRDQLVEIRKQERTRLQLQVGKGSRRSIEHHITWLSTEIVKLDKAIAARVSGSEQISRHVRLLTSIPGIGIVTATVLVALLPELGCRSRRSIAALAGLAPINHDSGKHRGQRRIRGGRRRVREALYMAALSTSHTCPRFNAFYQQRLQNSAKPKQALIALARKILTTANAIIRDQKPFTA